MFSLKPDFERAEDAVDKFEQAYYAKTGKHSKPEENYFEEYLQLSRLIQSIFISDDGYVIDTGNFQTCNVAIVRDILERVKRHPILWKIFMVV